MRSSSEKDECHQENRGDESLPLSKHCVSEVLLLGLLRPSLFATGANCTGRLLLSGGKAVCRPQAAGNLQVQYLLTESQRSRSADVGTALSTLLGQEYTRLTL